MKMDDLDKLSTVEKYQNAYKEYGYSPKTLGWDKGRQDIRFEVLLSFFDYDEKSILDIGCGFGDLNRILSLNGSNYRYTGIDLVEDLISEGQIQYPQKHVNFLKADFLEYKFDEPFDIIVASGIFNHKFPNGGNDLFRQRVMQKAWSLCKEGFAFDFLSTKVDYCYQHTYHNDPELVLGEAYKLTRKVALRNDYMPFEFCVYVGKDNSFDPTDAVFSSHKKSTGRK